MKKVIFVCHGNICRSPAAEFIFLKEIEELGLKDKFIVKSKATSYEEIGNDIYPPMKEELRRQNIPFVIHKASRITKEDYLWADYIFYMEDINKRNMTYIFIDTEHKVLPVYQFTEGINRIEDPWYTDRYYLVVEQLRKCIKDILKNI